MRRRDVLDEAETVVNQDAIGQEKIRASVRPFVSSCVFVSIELLAQQAERDLKWEPPLEESHEESPADELMTLRLR